MTRSASCTPFFTFSTLSRQRVTSLLKSSSSNSSSCGAFFFFLLSGCSKQQRSWIFRSRVNSFRWVAVVLCASLKIWAMSVRREMSGPSSGTSTLAAEARVLPADFRVVVVVVVVDERAERVERVDVRPGMARVCACAWACAWVSSHAGAASHNHRVRVFVYGWPRFRQACARAVVADRCGRGG